MKCEQGIKKHMKEGAGLEDEISHIKVNAFEEGDGTS